jgi:hypothetical protein
LARKIRQKREEFDEEDIHTFNVNESHVSASLVQLEEEFKREYLKRMNQISTSALSGTSSPNMRKNTKTSRYQNSWADLDHRTNS